MMKKVTQKEDITFLNSIHEFQCDLAVFFPFSIDSITAKQQTMPRTYCYKIYQLYTWLWLSFLHRSEMHDGTIEIDLIEEQIEEMKEEFVRYNLKVEAKKEN